MKRNTSCLTSSGLTGILNSFNFSTFFSLKNTSKITDFEVSKNKHTSE